MDNFFIYVTIFAVLLLIICLTGVGILMRYQNAGIAFPPFQNPCPDGWVPSGTAGCKNPANTGFSGITGTAPSGMTYIKDGSTVFNVVDFGSTSICDKKKWSNNYNIAWDGVSNYSLC
jgi:hypothetical protein